MTDSDAIQPIVVDPQEDGEEVIELDCSCPHCGQYVVARYVMGNNPDGTLGLSLDLGLLKGLERRVH